MGNCRARQNVPGDCLQISTKHRLRGVSLAVSLLAGVLASGCSATSPPPGDEPALTPLCVSSGNSHHILLVEIADTPAERRRGLQHRPGLSADHGMLFSYRRDQSVNSAFWMYRTPTPLSIAFIDQNGIIINIVDMPPCQSDKASDCPTFQASKPYRYALEVNQGYFRQHGVEAGDRINPHSLDDCNSGLAL